MNWADQTSQLFNTWTDAQKQMWAGWANMLQGGAMGGQSLPGLDPMQWMRSAVDMWSGAQGGAAGRAAGNIFGSSDMMMRSVGLLMKAWEIAAPKIEAGKPWQPDLQQTIEMWKDAVFNFPARQTATTSEFAELAKTMFERWTPMTAPWMSMVTQALASGHPGAAFMSGTSGVNRIMGFEEGMMPIMSGLGELPRGTVVREKMGKMLRAVDALTDLRKRQAEFQKAMADAMGKAVENTIAHIAKMAEKGEKITSVRELMRTWFTVADQTLNVAFQTPEFQAVQNRMTEALMTHKVRQREALEVVYSSLELPTRSEVDEAYRDIHALKKEVRRLRQQVKELTAGAAAKATKRVAAKAETEQPA